LTDHKFKFDDLNGENIFEPELRAEISEYLRHDCLSLAQIMIDFREQLAADPKIEIDITDCFTSSTLAKKLYFQKYYFRYCKRETNQYIYEVNKEIDQELRRSYFGGRCDVYGYGKFKDVYYYDFTSLYPSICAKNVLPIGDPVRVEGWEINLEKFYGFVCCQVTTNKDTLPLHGHKFNGKLVFAHHDKTEMLLFSEEIKYGLKMGYEYKPMYGYSFGNAPLLRDIMNDGFKLKADYKEAGQTVLSTTWKKVINSCYGFFGIRFADKRGVSLMTSDQLDIALD
jgi:DNA polymerase elongation subunit (family B)